jgi:hypothetical protein
MAEAENRLWEIPYVPPSLNRWHSMHWAARGRLVDEWSDFVWAFQHNPEKKIPTPQPWVYCAATMVFRTGAHRDLMNYDSVLWKIFADALQRHGVILDDDEHHFRRGKTTMKVDKKAGALGRDPRLRGLTRIVLVYPGVITESGDPALALPTESGDG